MKQTSGIPTFDVFMEGGLELGDNVVWLAGTLGDLDAVLDAFLAQPSGARPQPSGARPQPSGARPQPSGGMAVSRTICLGAPPECGHRADADGELVLHPVTGGGSGSNGLRSDEATMAELESVVLAEDIGEGARVVITALDDLLARFGAEATVGFYRRTCPRLFERGAIAYWVGSRELVGAQVAEGVTRVAQCVFELRDGRLRVIKAEGRSSWLQGAMVDLDLSGDTPVVSREHAVGRLGEGLKRVRAERSLTQAQMAELAHVTPAAVSQAETGRRGLSLDTLVPLVDALGLGLDDLLGTGRSRGPFIARPDRRHARSGSALFDDPQSGPLVHLVELDGAESRAVPVVTHGTELVLCAQGLVMVDLGDTTPVLRAHDALMVIEESVLSFTNLADVPARVFWVAL